jgi:phosphoserine phosphatase
MIAKEQIEAALVEVAVKELDEGMSSVLEQAGVDVNDLRQVAIQQCLDVADDLVDAIRRDTGTTVTSGTAMLIVSKLAAEMGLGFSAGLKMGRKDFEHFMREVQSDDDRVGDVLARAGLEDRNG